MCMTEGLLTVSFAGQVGADAQGGGTNDIQQDIKRRAVEKDRASRFMTGLVHLRSQAQPCSVS